MLIISHLSAEVFGFDELVVPSWSAVVAVCRGTLSKVNRTRRRCPLKPGPSSLCALTCVCVWVCGLCKLVTTFTKQFTRLSHKRVLMLLLKC